MGNTPPLYLPSPPSPFLPATFFFTRVNSTIDVNEWVAVAGLTAKGSVEDRLAGTSYFVSSCSRVC
jgi:hypothetical protein